MIPELHAKELDLNRQCCARILTKGRWQLQGLILSTPVFIVLSWMPLLHQVPLVVSIVMKALVSFHLWGRKYLFHCCNLLLPIPKTKGFDKVECFKCCSLLIYVVYSQKRMKDNFLVMLMPILMKGVHIYFQAMKSIENAS